METEKFIVMSAKVTLEDIRSVIAEELRLHLKEQKQNEFEKLYYIAQVSRLLRKSHKTVKNMVLSGVIRSTKNGMIPESAIEEFLRGK